jgi:hypothetical protein
MKLKTKHLQRLIDHPEYLRELGLSEVCVGMEVDHHLLDVVLNKIANPPKSRKAKRRMMTLCEYGDKIREDALKKLAK